MKLGIGTAQFIKNYGFMKKKIKLDKYFKTLNNSKINLIDTAQEYSDAEELIGKYLSLKKKIITKVKPMREISQSKKLEFFKKSLETSMKKLKREKIYGLLLHDENDIFQNDDFYKFIEEIKKNKIIKKFGYSTYDIFKDNIYKRYFNFDLIQAPFNIFDANSRKIKMFKQIKKNKEIHIRSIFLQGLVLNEQNANSSYKSIKDKLNIMDNLISKKNIKNRYQYVISLINNLNIADYCIIGCLNHYEIENLNKFKSSKINLKDLYKFQIKNKKILDLRNWN